MRGGGSSKGEIYSRCGVTHAVTLKARVEIPCH
jgi:hypothetical protein